MSLTFTQASTNKVTVTNPLTFGSGTEFTYILWVKQSATPSNSQGTNKGGADIFRYFTDWGAEIPRATTASAVQVANAAIFPNLNEWVYLAITYSETNGCSYYRGTLTSAPSLLTNVSKTIGSGATSANTGDLYISNRGASNTLSPAHTISGVQLLNKELTLGEITRLWSCLQTDVNTKLLLRLGDNGTGTQNDLSGNGNNGTVTGATQSANAPLRRFGRIIMFPTPSAAGGSSTLSADAGSYSFTGQASKFDLTQSTGSGSYAFTGTAALFDTKLIASSGSYSFAGAAATFDTELNVDSGSYSFTGAASTFDISLNANAGAYNFTGADADLVAEISYTLSAEAGSYVFTGSDANLIDSGSNQTNSGGYWYQGPEPLYRRIKELDEQETEVIVSLAEIQSSDLKQTEKDRNEQLTQELKLKNIQVELKHIQALNQERQILIDAEIASLMKVAQIEAENQQYLELVLLAAAA